MFSIFLCIHIVHTTIALPSLLNPLKFHPHDLALSNPYITTSPDIRRCFHCFQNCYRRSNHCAIDDFMCGVRYQYRWIQRPIRQSRMVVNTYEITTTIISKTYHIWCYGKENSITGTIDSSYSCKYCWQEGICRSSQSNKTYQDAGDLDTWFFPPLSSSLPFFQYLLLAMILISRCH